MDISQSPKAAKTFKIECTQYPEIFEIDKSVCKTYFRQYGKVLRVIFKRRTRSIVIEYTNLNDYLNALAGNNEFEGHPFKLEPFEPRVPQHQTSKKQDKMVQRHKLGHMKSDIKINVSYVDNREVNDELEAMRGYLNPKETFEVKKGPKLNRVWTRAEMPKKELVQKRSIKTKSKEKFPIVNAEQFELLKVMKLQATTVEEKYKVLDARDKLLRLNKKKTELQYSPTVGTCADMCPEKERLLREIQHQVSIYEQGAMGRNCMDHMKAVKQYSRSSADQDAPLPQELRPVNVLQMTMVYLMHNIMDLADNDPDVNIGEWFHFLWDRTRGIRKDITQQALCSQTSVELVEQCARFHIHCSARLTGEDPAVFDQKINTENLTKCLQTLKYMYHDLELKGEICPNESEFRAYIILLNLSDGNFMWEVQQLRQDIQKSNEIKLALQIYSAFEKRNYVKFFKLIRSTTYLNACILMRYFLQVRVQALEFLIKCFTPPKSISFYPIAQLTRILLFDNSESTIDFMQNYGIVVNKDCTHFLIERNSFYVPETPYSLQRSQEVEAKRSLSVGLTVNGKAISTELYRKMQFHQVHSSFDEKGFLVHDEMFDEIEVRMEDKFLADSREASPEPPNILITLSNTKQSPPPNIFKKDPHPNLFASDVKPESRNIFKPKDETDSQMFNKPSFPPRPNIFASSLREPAPIFAKSNVKDPTKPVKKGGFPFDLQTAKTTEVANIFALKSSPSKPVLFHGPSPEELRKIEEDRMRRLKMEEEIERLKAEEEKRRLQLDEEKRRLEVERRQLEFEEMRRKNEEAAAKRREFERIKQLEEEEQRKNQEQLKELQRQERERLAELERIKKLNEARRLEEKRKEEARIKHIHDTVSSILKQLVDKVDTNLREEALERIRRNIKKRSLKKVCKRWKFFANRRMKRRKAFDCNPIFVHGKSVEDCAKDFRSPSQDLALRDIKRYKYGKPLEIPVFKDPAINKLDCFQLVYSSLRRTLCELKEKWRQHIYWKVTISLPDIDEMVTGLHKLEQSIKSYISWELDKYGNTAYIETHKSATFGIEKQQGCRVKSSDSNGFIFIGKTFTDIMQMRVVENLKDFGIFVKLPIVVILETTEGCEEYLDSLKQSEVVSDYVVYSCNIHSKVILDFIDNALIFLSKRVQTYPPLEMDILYDFLENNLCTEIWKKAGSYARWNVEYNCCMQDPNLVINLYNQGVDLLLKIIGDKSCKEFAKFPDIFQEYLPDRLPDSYPCDYRFFPTFWSSPNYTDHLKSTIETMKLPKLFEKWPPQSDADLQSAIYNYCEAALADYQAPARSIINLLHNDDTGWIDIIQILAHEKLHQQNFKLPKDVFSNLYDNFVVVYNVEMLNEYCTSEWFYRNNPLVESYKKIQTPQMRIQPVKRKRCVEFDIEDAMSAIEKAEKVLKSRKVDCRKISCQMEELNMSIEDLEDSIKIVKHIDNMDLFKN